MTRQAKREYINAQRIRYRSAMKSVQGALLDKMVSVTSYNRKYLIRALSKKPAPGSSRVGSKATSSAKDGRPPSYRFQQDFGIVGSIIGHRSEPNTLISRFDPNR